MGNFTPEETTVLQWGLGDTATPAHMYAAVTGKHWTSYPLYNVTMHMWAVCLPVIFLMGIFGNIMIIIIMQRMASQESTINIYFTALAVMDIGYLLWLGVPEWLICLFGFGFMSSHEMIPKVHASLYTWCGTTGCWCLVCVTVHRAISVVWPHRVNLLCTRRIVRLLLTGITVFIGVLYFHHNILFFNTDPANNESIPYCGQLSENYVFFNDNVFMFIDMLVYCVLPFVFLAVSNSVLVWKLTVSVKAAGRHLTKGDSEKVQAREKAANSVTLTVIVVSVNFLVLTLPQTVSGILNYPAMMSLREQTGHTLTEVHGVVNASTLKDFMDSEGVKLTKANFAHSISTLLSLCNSAVNFYLYCLTGRRFREEFIKVIACGRNRRRRGASSVTADVTEQSARHT